MQIVDLQFCNLGFAASCMPMTEVGRDWLAENIGDETTTYGGALIIEQGYLADIVNGARDAGLVCEG